MKLLYAFAFTTALLSGMVSKSSEAQESFISLESVTEGSVIGTQWVQPSGDGAISGSVTVMADRQQSLVGEMVLATPDGVPQVVPVNAEGSFRLEGVEPGVYTLVYQSRSAFSAFALHVMPAAEASTLEKQVFVSAAVITPADALGKIAKYQPTEVSRSFEIGQDATAPKQSADGGTELYQVYQSAAGGLRGRLIEAGTSASGLRAAAGVNAMVYAGSREVGRAVSADDGNFEISSLEPGNYTLVASGASGFAVIGFELIASQEVLTATSMTASVKANAARRQTADVLVVQIAPPDPNVVGSSSDNGNEGEEGIAGAPMFDPLAPGSSMGGGFGGGGGGFSGGGGGGGGGGMGIGALAALGAALAASLGGDNNGGTFTPAPASPATP